MTPDPRLVLLVGAALWGVALAWATRLGPRSRRLRAWLVPTTLNLGAVAALAAVLLAGDGPASVARVPWSWAVAGGVGLVVAALALRFPRAAGLPLVVAGVALGWLVSLDVAGYVPLENPSRVAQVRLLAENDRGRTFEVRRELGGGLVDESLQELGAGAWPLPQWELLDVPNWVPVPASRWLRPASATHLGLIPADWVRQLAPAPVAKPNKFAVYRLSVAPGVPAWSQALPSLVP